jgi:hypothetical protein
MQDAPIRMLLGPQRPKSNVSEAVAGLPAGPLAVISAGWQEAEGDLDELQAAVGRPVEDLRLYFRAEEVFQQNEQLVEAYRSRQDQLKEQQRLYRRRLKQLSIAARQTFRAEGDQEMIAAEQRHAIAQLRALDRHHVRRTEAIHKRFAADFSIETHAALAAHQEEIRAQLDRSAGVLVTGGNIVVLLNRMRLFDVGALLAGKNIVAWSAGAMVLTDRIVLFHERMPLERRDPEILGAGFGIVPRFVLFPNGADRLREKDRLRIGLTSRRFSPAVCAVLDSGAALTIGGTTLVRAENAQRLSAAGRVQKLRVT